MLLRLAEIRPQLFQQLTQCTNVPSGSHGPSALLGYDSTFFNFLSGPASDQLKTLRYGIDVIINDQKVNMIGSDRIIQDLKTKTLFCLKKASSASVAGPWRISAGTPFYGIDE